MLHSEDTGVRRWDMRLAGRTAVVVGVGSSVGRACAERFAREGAEVLAVDPSHEVAAAVAEAIAGAGGRAVAFAADVGSDAGAREVAARCGALWERVDVLACCAALVDFFLPLSEESSTARWEEVLRVSLLGPVAYTHALVPLLRRSRAGSIVYLGSIDGSRGNPNIPAYSTAKGGLVPLTHVMAHSLGRDGIRVNTVATSAIHQDGSQAKPRPIRTDPASLMRATPLGRRATPEDVAAVFLFFASDDAAYVTGTVLPVDGGRSAITPGTGATLAEA